MKILVIEDNDTLRETVCSYLELDGFEVAEFADLPDTDEILKAEPDCVILDIMLPSGNGLLRGKQLREQSSVPLIFLTARVSESDRITGLEVGADDYITKPFSPRELVLRVRAVLRRGGYPSTGAAQAEMDNLIGGSEPARRRYRCGEGRMELYDALHQLVVDGSEVKLTAAEWNFITFLSRRPGQIFSRMQLLESCLGSVADGSERTVDTHIKNLRHKLGDGNWIETERGFGYRFAGTELP